MPGEVRKPFIRGGTLSQTKLNDSGKLNHSLNVGTSAYVHTYVISFSNPEVRQLLTLNYVSYAVTRTEAINIYPLQTLSVNYRYLENRLNIRKINPFALLNQTVLK